MHLNTPSHMFRNIIGVPSAHPLRQSILRLIEIPRLLEYRRSRYVGDAGSRRRAQDSTASARQTGEEVGAWSVAI